ncbi:MAG: FeoB-associated Cys-rich membrane protein [Clostridia bacterium]|nr:FeoB-associated Cys-rich membrane protein [Clostridia bacterium]
MLDTIMENAGTILVSLLLIGLVAGIIVKLRRDKKQGKSSCGGNCGCCPMGGCCHKQS